MSTRTTISRIAAIGGLSTAVATGSHRLRRGGPAATSGSAGKLTVLVEAGGKAELQPSPISTRRTPERRQLVELPYDGLFNRLPASSARASLLRRRGARRHLADRFKDGVQPLDDLFTDEVKKDIFPALVNEAQVGGHFIGMPAWTNAEIIFYRNDLFDDAEEQGRLPGEVRVRARAADHLEAVPGHLRVLHRRHGMYGTDVKGAVETEWLATVSQAG